jgi:hypothetical protein
MHMLAAPIMLHSMIGPLLPIGAHQLTYGWVRLDLRRRVTTGCSICSAML